MTPNAAAEHKSDKATAELNAVVAFGMDGWAFLAAVLQMLGNSRSRLYKPNFQTPLPMKMFRCTLLVIASFCAMLLVGCEKKPADSADAHGESDPSAVKDAGQEQVIAFRNNTRKAYNESRFDDLEKAATAIRAGKALTSSGGWTIVQFYDSLECADDDPARMWELHEKIHKAWITAKPQSITARVAYADFLVNYAWQARGSGFTNTVTERGWALMRDRLAASLQVLKNARNLPEKDPNWWMVSLRVALGQGWSPADYASLLAEARAHEPKFWGYDTARAYSLLPRWHGKPGDWEVFAEQAATRPGGLGDETYARIVINLKGFYGNVFKETKASWPRTKSGLKLMTQRYPNSKEIVHQNARLARLADDRGFAKEMFAKIGPEFLPGSWKNAAQFREVKQWAAQ